MDLEEISQATKLHPYGTKARIIREIERVKNMSPESEKFFGAKAEHLEKLQRILKAINRFIRNRRKKKSPIVRTKPFSEYFNRKCKDKDKSE